MAGRNRTKSPAELSEIRNSASPANRVRYNRPKSKIIPPKRVVKQTKNPNYQNKRRDPNAALNNKTTGCHDHEQRSENDAVHTRLAQR